MTLRTVAVWIAAALCLTTFGAPTGDTPQPAAPEARLGVLALAVAPAPTGATAQQLTSATGGFWQSAPRFILHLNRTPPIYPNDPFDDGKRPQALVQLLRMTDGAVAVRLHWTDASTNTGPTAATYPDAGEKHIYKQHSRGIETFADAACVMAPAQRGPHTTYPALMMGDPAQPVDLYFWRAGTGLQTLRAGGRASTATTTAQPVGRSIREADGWTVIMLLPNLPAQTPVAFALWDGSKGQRGGIKYVSLWHEVQ
jgi:complex iron-sulfur molybdoenzyme family reductase subunit gamma